MTRLTALVVDDHAEIRTLIARILAEGGFDIIGQAENGAQALEMAARLAPDVITLDVAMPEVSGLEALPKLRAELPGAVIVMLTMNKQYEEKARSGGADGYILKHRAATDLIPAIHAACQAAQVRMSDRIDQLADLQDRVATARRRYSAARREARHAAELMLDLQAETSGSPDGTFAAAKARGLDEAAGEAMHEYLEAVAELRRFHENRDSPRANTATGSGDAESS